MAWHSAGTKPDQRGVEEVTCTAKVCALFFLVPHSLHPLPLLQVRSTTSRQRSEGLPSFFCTGHIVPSCFSSSPWSVAGPLLAPARRMNVFGANGETREERELHQTCMYSVPMQALIRPRGVECLSERARQVMVIESLAAWLGYSCGLQAASGTLTTRLEPQHLRKERWRVLGLGLGVRISGWAADLGACGLVDASAGMLR